MPLTQALERTGPKLGDVATVRLDVIADSGLRRAPRVPAHPADRFSLKLGLAEAFPASGVVEQSGGRRRRAPAVGFPGGFPFSPRDSAEVSAAFTEMQPVRLNPAAVGAWAAFLVGVCPRLFCVATCVAGVALSHQRPAFASTSDRCATTASLNRGVNEGLCGGIQPQSPSLTTLSVDGAVVQRLARAAAPRHATARAREQCRRSARTPHLAQTKMRARAGDRCRCCHPRLADFVWGKGAELRRSGLSAVTKVCERRWAGLRSNAREIPNTPPLPSSGVERVPRVGRQAVWSDSVRVPDAPLGLACRLLRLDRAIVAGLACRLLRLDRAIVAGLAGRLQSGRVEEQALVALVGLAVVDHGGRDEEALGLAALAEWLGLELGLAERSPLGGVVEFPVRCCLWAALVGAHHDWLV
jgi:hypothetical protein